MEKLKAVRNSLRTGLEKSKAISSALEKSGSSLEEIKDRLSSLGNQVRPIRADVKSLATVRGHINRALGPASAVLKVFDAVHGLEKSLLSDPKSDLIGFLSVLQHLEEALKLLTENCGLAIQWLEDVVGSLEDNKAADDLYLSNFKKSLEYLRLLAKEEKTLLDGGLLVVVLDKLENEFRRLLTEHSTPLAMSFSPLEQPCIAPSPLPVQVIQKLQLILDRLATNNVLHKCISIYDDVRSANVKLCLKSLNLDYLELSTSKFSDVQSIEGHISHWGRDLEFAVKQLFDVEYRLCWDVFERMEVDIPIDCFSNIVLKSEIFSFLRFGVTVTESKKDPIKLLKLLDIFSYLNKLRPNFRRLFGGKACREIQNLTRDLIKRVIVGACEILFELLVQVELQRQNPPPSNGNVPQLVSFMIEYCNKLLNDDYRPILNQVLAIHYSWKRENYQEKILIEVIENIINALELNLDSWSKTYKDTSLSHIFLMNTHWHFYKHLEGTILGEILGDAWLKEHEKSKDYYAALYLKETWANLPSLLGRESLILFSGGQATARDLVKKRLKKFNEAFDELFKRQLNWVVPDDNLREKTCQLAVQTIVPVYRSYMQNYGPLVEQDSSASKYAKYTAQKLQSMLGSLFQQKLSNSSSMQFRHSNGKLNKVESKLFESPPTVY